MTSSAEMVASAELRPQVQQAEKIDSTQSSCKFLYCGGTCGRPDCEERALNIDSLPVNPPPNVDFYPNLDRRGGSLYIDLFGNLPKVGNRFGATTGMPHLPAPPELEAESELESADSNFFTSNDSEPPIIIELSSDSESPSRTYKTPRINEDPPSPSRKNATRQRALRIGTGVRPIKKRSLNTS